MATYPPRGLAPWDEELKAYIDDSTAGSSTDAGVAHQIENGAQTDAALAGAVTAGGEFETALTAAIARPQAPFAFVSATQYGDSWGNNSGGSSAPITSAFGYRICAALRTLALTDRSVSGTRSNQIQQQVESTWTAPGYGLVLIADVVLNDLASAYTDAHTREAFRSTLAQLCAVNVAGITSAAITYGPGWTSGVSDGTAGRYADIAFVGDTAYIRWNAVTSAGGTFTVKDNAGTTLATVSTGGYGAAFSGVTKISGLGAGTHSLRVAVTTGTVGLTGVLAQSTVPPTILWNQPGPIPARNATAQAAKIAACATVLADFPTVHALDAGSDWDSSTMISTDGLHLNDLGNDHLTLRGLDVLSALGYRDGQNRLTQPTAYTVPSPAYDGPGATAPAAPTSVAGTLGNQVSLTWTVGTDGGATITSQSVRASSNGGSTWTTVASGLPLSATSTVITTGLTEGTGYIFQVGATNAHGTTWSTSSSAITAGASPATYSADALTGSGAMGTATTGGQTWTTSHVSTTYARSSTGSSPSAVGNNGQGDLYVDDGHANGTIELTVATVASGGVGILFNYDTTAHTGYIFRASPGGAYALIARTGLASYNTGTPIATATGTAAANGDVIKVVKNGTSIKIYLNGTKVIDVTDSTYSGTAHGTWVYSATSAKFTGWSHTSSVLAP